MDGGINFRDLGGYITEDDRQVVWRKIFRCGHLANLTTEDLDTLAALNVTAVHDFRRQDEQRRSPSQPVRASIYDDYEMSIGSMSKFWEYMAAEKLSSDSAHQLVVSSYRSCIDDVAPHYARLFQGLLTNDGAASVFHCSAGKDRTGLAAALILSALGVPRDVVVDDYLLTQEYFDSAGLIQLVEQHLRDAKVEYWERSWLMPYCGVHRDNIEAFFDGVESRYGSVMGYLNEGMGLSGEDLLRLKQLYLTE
ncbi:tyrosine-protein phosphatase [Pseudomaricurvus hydrocarbonicus]